MRINRWWVVATGADCSKFTTSINSTILLLTSIQAQQQAFKQQQTVLCRKCKRQQTWQRRQHYRVWIKLTFLRYSAFQDQRLSSYIFPCSYRPAWWHLHLSPLYDIFDHTNHIFYVRIYPGNMSLSSCDHIMINISSYTGIPGIPSGYYTNSGKYWVRREWQREKIIFLKMLIT